MNKVFLKVEKVENSRVGDLQSYTVVASDNYVEDIVLDFLGPQDILDWTPPELVSFISLKDDDVADLMEAAEINGTDIYLNDGSEPFRLEESPSGAMSP